MKLNEKNLVLKKLKGISEIQETFMTDALQNVSEVAKTLNMDEKRILEYAEGLLNDINDDAYNRIANTYDALCRSQQG